jgi:hypothetical protein
LSLVVAEACALARPLADEKDLTLSIFTASATPVKVWGDLVVGQFEIDQG